jgi:hypothetical protein
MHYKVRSIHLEKSRGLLFVSDIGSTSMAGRGIKGACGRYDSQVGSLTSLRDDLDGELYYYYTRRCCRLLS